ncbi:uncharacterized protein LOC131166728 [Malania oleifera]|uniref:uncharacterized protein LOC131166728 n=1 Tax=Malania oleifera TaxID=397392 RepID=UPI0025ADDB43|nr:uncharacterized protein LOC131166728 [Malania oleifera]
MKPPSFSRGSDPLVAESWVQSIEDMLVVLPCTDEHKEVFVTFKLTREAKCWWRSTNLIEEKRLDLVAVTWSQFLELFFDRYFPAIVRRVKAVEFLHLTQEQLTIQQYATCSIELSRFSPHLVPDKEKKARKFEEDLRQNLFEQVIGFQAQIFAEVVDKAAIIESDMQRGTAAQSQRKRPMPQGFQAGSS